MKTVNTQSQPIKKLAPEVAGFGRDGAGHRLAVGFDFCKQIDEGGGDRDGEGHIGPAFGAGEGHRLGDQIHPVERNGSFTESASSSQPYLETYSHPTGKHRGAQGSSNQGNLLRREGREGSDLGRILDSVVVEGVSLQSAQQPALPLDPLHHLNVSAGLVSVDLVAGSVAVGIGGAAITATPNDIGFSGRRAELAELQAVLRKEKLQPIPRVKVVANRQMTCRPIFNVISNPAMVLEKFFVFVNAQLGRLGQRLSSVQLGVSLPAGSFSLPDPVRFISDRVGLLASSFIYRGHDTNVAKATFA
jgi:hypothetical protein